MAADPGLDRRDSQPVPAQRDDPGPLDLVWGRMPGTRQPADLPALAVIQRRAAQANAAGILVVTALITAEAIRRLLDPPAGRGRRGGGGRARGHGGQYGRGAGRA